LLDRRFGGRWSPKQRIDHSGMIKTENTTRVIDATADDEQEYIAQLSQATGHTNGATH
jgi:hypothetical protein